MGMIGMGYRWRLAACSAILSMSFAGTVFAGSWNSNETGTWWQFEDGSYPIDRSMLIDEDFDGSGYIYYFDKDGYLARNDSSQEHPTNDKGQLLMADGTVQSDMTYADYVGSNTDGITGYYYGTEGIMEWSNGTASSYQIYYGLAVKEIDANTISVLSDQYDFYEPAIYHKISDGVYQAIYESAAYTITFEGSNLIMNDGYGPETFKK